MYTHFYKLAEPAFEIRPQQTFLWSDTSRNASVDTLREGIEMRLPFQLVTGAAGSGKTTLLRQLLDSVGEDTLVARITADIDTDIVELYNAIASGFGLQKEVSGKVEFVIELSQILKKRGEEGKASLLVIDDGQKLEQEAFEELRMLLGLEKDGKPLVTLLLAGRPELVESLARPANRILRQKLMSHIEIKPLSEEETQRYVEYRLKVAGAAAEIFEPEAFEVITECTKGLPGSINALCSNVLEGAARQGITTISALFVTRCILDNAPAPHVTGLKQMGKKTQAARPPREAVARTAASVAAAVEAAVGNMPETSLEEPRRRKRHRKKENSLFLRGVIAVSLCLGLYFLYQYFFSSASDHPVSGTDVSVAEPFAMKTEGPPLVAPSARPLEELEPLRINALPSVQPAVPSAVENISFNGPGQGRIRLHPLQVVGREK